MTNDNTAGIMIAFQNKLIRQFTEINLIGIVPHSQNRNKVLLSDFIFYKRPDCIFVGQFAK